MGRESELCPVNQISYKEPTGLWKWYKTEKQLQWIFDITYLYSNEVLTLTSDIFCPSSSKININNLYKTKPRYSEQILTVSHGPFSLYRAVPLYFNVTSQCKLPLPQKKFKIRWLRNLSSRLWFKRKKYTFYILILRPEQESATFSYDWQNTININSQSTRFILPPRNVDRTIQSQSTGVKAQR